MLAASLKSLLSYRGRLFSTILAIALGVGFVTGTMLFTESIEASLTSAVTAQEQGVDVAVGNADAVDEDTGGLSPGRVSPVLAQRVAQVQGVAVAEGRIDGAIQLLDAQGNRLGRTNSGLRVISVATTPELRWMEAAKGRIPAKSGEIAVDADTMEAAELKIGQQVQIIVRDAPKAVTIVGVVDQAESPLATGGNVAAVPRSDLEVLAGDFAVYSRVDVVAAEGVDPAQLAASIEQALEPLANAQPDGVGPELAPLAGKQFAAVTNEELVAAAKAGLATALQLFQLMLSAFAAIALFVAAYVINNTFTILITQRAKQLALMRCLGAKRGQVFRATVVEALSLGLVASLLGLGLGVALVFGFDRLLGLFDIDTGEVVIRPNLTIIGIAVGAGVLMTLIGSVVPALRATRVSPLAAMRTTALSAVSRPKLRTTILGVLMLAGGVAGLYLGISSGEVQISLVGAMFTFLGVTTLSPWIVGPLARLLGLVSRVRISGKLATENTVRNPKRTAATTGALIIGVTLMTIFVVVAESARVSALQQLEEEFPIDYTVTIQRGALPGDVKQALNEAPQFAGWIEKRRGTLELNGELIPQVVSGVDLEALAGPAGQTIDLGVQAGSVQELPGFNIGLSSELAKELGVTYGDALPVEGSASNGTPKRFEVRVSLVYTNEVFGPAMLSRNTLHGMSGGQTRQATAFIKLADGADAEAAREAIEAALTPYPEANVQDRVGFVEDVTNSVNQLLAIVGGMLGLAIIIALLGIANTLGLSVIERVRESAVLRSLGLTRGQLRGMMATEAILTSLIGAVMGLGLGLMFVYAGLTAVGDVVTIAIPWIQVAAGLAGAIVVGLFASILPGRAAARTDIVRAMVAE